MSECPYNGEFPAGQKTYEGAAAERERDLWEKYCRHGLLAEQTEIAKIEHKRTVPSCVAAFSFKAKLIPFPPLRTQLF